ncbi:MAG: hypothetical protein ACLTS6_06955 [Anaerobutyricum sp.]
MEQTDHCGQMIILSYNMKLIYCRSIANIYNVSNKKCCGQFGWWF